MFSMFFNFVPVTNDGRVTHQGFPPPIERGWFFNQVQNVAINHCTRIHWEKQGLVEGSCSILKAALNALLTLYDIYVY